MSAKQIISLIALAATPIALCMFLLIPNYKLYLIHTGSMGPTIPIGSVVLVHKGSVRPGEVITFRPLDGSTLVTHRLVGINPNGTLITKGDGNKTPDVDVVTRADVVGHVVAAPRHVGSWINFAFHSKLGLVFDTLFLAMVALMLTSFGSEEPARPARGAHRSLT